jgi:RHS repeat-associated protein
VAETNYVFFNGKRVARRDPSGAVHYYLSDHLGSTTMVVSAAGAIENESDYYPWGGELKISAADAGNHYKFTGKERDPESGLDYFGARYYGNGLGRFTTADPLMLQKQKFTDPQQWNMYQYARDNPLRFVDPTGKAIQLSDDAKERAKQVAGFQQAVGKEAGKYLYASDKPEKDGHYYLKVYSNGPDGKGPDFAKLNAVANKMNGIIQDERVAQVVFQAPHGNLGSLSDGKTPAMSWATNSYAEITISSGEMGKFQPDLASDGRAYEPTLGDALSHELGHIDAVWYHGAESPSGVGDPISNGDAVRIENQTRQLNGEPLRTGHNKRGDVDLTGVPF